MPDLLNMDNTLSEDKEDKVDPFGHTNPYDIMAMRKYKLSQR
jgi:hypothetical protein